MAPRAVIIGSGTEIPQNLVTNDMLARLMDTSDEWIRERSGVETRYYVDPGTGTSDLGVAAARKALLQAQVPPEEVDLVVFATMTPDHYFPGAGALLQAKLGCGTCPASTSASSASGSCTGCSSPTRTSARAWRKTVLLIGAEIHSGFMPWNGPQWEYLYGRSDTPPHRGGARVEHALPPPDGPLRGRGRRGGAARARRRARDRRPDAAHGRGRLRQAVRAGHGIQAPALRGRGTALARRPHPGDGRAPRLQDGHDAHGRGVERAARAQRRVRLRRDARAHAPGEQADQRVLPEGARDPRLQDPPQHRALREHDRGHHPAAVGRVRRGRAACIRGISS